MLTCDVAAGLQQRLLAACVHTLEKKLLPLVAPGVEWRLYQVSMFWINACGTLSLMHTHLVILGPACPNNEIDERRNALHLD